MVGFSVVLGGYGWHVGGDADCNHKRGHRQKPKTKRAETKHLIADRHIFKWLSTEVVSVGGGVATRIRLRGWCHDSATRTRATTPFGRT